MLLLYAERRKCQPVHYKNIAQKSAADFMQIDETKIPASYDGQPGKCFVFYSFVPINNSESFSIYVSDQKPMLFSFNGNIFFEVSNIHIFYISFSKCFFIFLMSRSYHIAPHLSVDVLHKNYILELYKTTMGYSVQIPKKL